MSRFPDSPDVPPLAAKRSGWHALRLCEGRGRNDIPLEMSPRRTLASIVALCSLLTTPIALAEDSTRPSTPAANTPAAKPAAARPLAWSDSLARGLVQAQRQRRPILVKAEGVDCVHCRAMAVEIAKPAVQAALKDWTLVSIEVDQSPDDARRLAVGPIPAFRILTPAGKLVAQREGATSADEFAAWLAQHVEAASVVPPELLADDSEPDAATVTKLVREFKSRDAVAREAAIRRLLPWPDRAAVPVAAAFRDGPLATRLAALEALREWKAPVDGLDPWRPESIDEPKLKALTDWAATAKRDAEAASRAPLAGTELAEAKDALARLLAASPAEAAPLRERLARHGRRLLPEVYAALRDAPTDEAREALTALRYRLVATQALALGWPGGIERLAASDATVRAKAADELVKRATAADESLLLELFSDPSPLVRELSLRALRSVGGENADSALLKLLDDPQPNVRAAVLKQLSETPSKSMIPRIAAYAESERDADLVLHAVRVLRETKDVSAVPGLHKLLDHESWQVRAEAVEGLDKLVNNRYDLINQNELKAEVHAAIVAKLKDSDGFVVGRAVQSLTDSTLPAVVDALADALKAHPELSREIISALAHNRADQERAARRLREFAKHENPRVRAAALTGLSEMDAGSLETALRTGLADPEADVRIAAADGLFMDLERLRAIESPRGALGTTLDEIASEAAEEMDVEEDRPPSRLGLFGQILSGLIGDKPAARPVAKPAPSAAPAAVPRPAASPDDGPALAEVPEASLPAADLAEVFVSRVRSGRLIEPAQRDLAPALAALLASERIDERVAAARPLAAMGDAAALAALRDAVDRDPKHIAAAATVLPWLFPSEREPLFAALVRPARVAADLMPVVAALTNVRAEWSAEALWRLAADRRADGELANEIREALTMLYLGNSGYDLNSVGVRFRSRAVAASQARAGSVAPFERLVAFAMLLMLEPESAAVAARPVFDDPAASPSDREDAFQVLLLSLPEEEATRLAVDRLSADAAIRRRVVEFLTQGRSSQLVLRGAMSLYFVSTYAGSSSGALGAPIVPAAPKGLTVEPLLPLLKDDDPKLAAMAGYLLALLGRPEGLDPLLAWWATVDRNDHDASRFVYRAVVKLNDPAQIPLLKEIYTRLRAEKGGGQTQEFYWTIRSMTGKEILDFRKEVRREMGSDNLR